MMGDDLYMPLGRLEGKMDILIQMQSSTASRLDAIESRLGSVEKDMAAHKSTTSTGRVWRGEVYAIGAMILTLLGLIYGATR